ncbi:6-phosphogluconolactonase [Legionella spiritensis]
MNNMHFHSFNDTDELNRALAGRIIDILREAITLRGHAYLVVSGGKTPQGLFQLLACTELDWRCVTVTLCDERLVKPDTLDSNERLVKDYLLRHKASGAHFISLYSDREDAMERKKDITRRLGKLPAFDVVVLGMGEDGHTASLFPCSPEIRDALADTDDVVVEVTPTSAPYARISLSKTRLLRSRAIFLHLVGERKRAVLEKALAEKEPLVMPIRAFLHHPVADVQIMFAPL